MPPPSPDFAHPYLTKQIIAYIGNKRRLLPLIHQAIVQSLGHTRTAGLAFIDLFAGSGAVSRMAKHLGFRVLCNDWEPYASVINGAYIEIDRKDLPGMFREHGGIEGILRVLNALPDPAPGDQYIARHFSPSSEETEGVDHRRERMFYTRRNGLAIDGIRNAIEELYPGDPLGLDGSEGGREKTILLALLLYEAATHTNTSGVFKAYHKGFGGHGRDALGRILAPVELEPPVLIDSAQRAEVFGEDANRLLLSEALKDRVFDVAYLDPPYNQHQYGSNYHLLNTIALWDKPAVSCRLNRAGTLDEKAAIRKDWIATKSAYCSRASAPKVLESLLGNLTARRILLSYSTEGIIPLEELLALCERKGRVELLTNEYVKYRGGRQSIRRLNRNLEFVLIIDAESQSTPKSSADIGTLLRKKRLALLFDKRYSLERLERNFIVERDSGTLRLAGVALTIETRDFFELIPPSGIEGLGGEQITLLIERLEQSACRDREEELAEILRKIGEGEGDRRFLVRLVPGTLRKFAHSKYRGKFLDWLGRVKEAGRADPGLYSLIEDRLRKLEDVAWKRFTG